MFAEPVPSFSANELDATVEFWEALGASTVVDRRGLRVGWDGAMIGYEASSRPTPPRITYGVGFVWQVDLDAVLTRAIEVGLWSVGVATPDDGQPGFDERLGAGLTIARIGLPRRTPTDVWECRLFDPSNNLVRLVAGPPQLPVPPVPPDETRGTDTP